MVGSAGLLDGTSTCVLVCTCETYTCSLQVKETRSRQGLELSRFQCHVMRKQVHTSSLPSFLPRSNLSFSHFTPRYSSYINSPLPPISPQTESKSTLANANNTAGGTKKRKSLGSDSQAEIRMLRRQSNSSSILTVSPTFSSYSSTRFAEIASRVVEEVNRENEEEEEMGGNEEDFLFSGAVTHLKQMGLDPPKEEEEQEEEISLEPSQPETATIENTVEGGEEDEDEDEEDDFEFPFVPRDPDAPPLAAGEMFANGQIRPIWPIFNRDLIFADSNESDESNKEQNPSPSIRLPMRKLLTEERNLPSPESDAMDRIPAGSYCVWRPKAHRSAKPESSSSSSCSSAAPGGCKKSNSTGSSKVWRFRDLMHRSSSNGQETMVFLSTESIKGGEKKGKAAVVGGKKGEKKREVSAHEIYLRNRMMSDGDRRRSFLPYRQDLVGFFANANGLSRSLHPF